MSLLIDGYNLLNASGVFARGRGPHTLERSRTALLDFLADHVDPRELPATRVVFDARQAPPGVPRTTAHRGLTVHYAAGYAEADDLIEELIRADSAPRNLTVVSSDHRLQRAARRRKATAVDSDAWLRQLIAQRHQREDASAPAKPHHTPSREEIAMWLERFGDVELGDPFAEQAPPLKDSDDVGELDELADPFPPGYGEDVLDEDSRDGN